MPKVRDAVLEQSKKAFEVIKIANGYNTDVKTVSRVLVEAFQLNDTDMPALFISDEGIEIQLDESDPTAIKHQLLIQVWGYFRDTSSLISTNFNNFLSDIIKVIYAPILYESSPGVKYADGVKFIGIEVKSENPPDIIFRVQFKVDYWFNKTSP